MGRRGSYLGGHTIVRSEALEVPVRPSSGLGNRPVSFGKPDHGQRRLVDKARQQKVADAIRKNEKLLKKVAKMWREEEGKNLFARLTAERQGDREGRARKHGSPSKPATGRALADALERALEDRKDHT